MHHQIGIGLAKTKVGVAFDPRTLSQLDRWVAESSELASHRSEIVNAIVASYLEKGPSKREITRLIKSSRQAWSPPHHTARASSGRKARRTATLGEEAIVV